jgi:flagellar biogenesis protein FliO
MDLLQQFASVAGVLALLGAALWVLQRKRLVLPLRRSPRELEVVERVALGPQHTLALVRVKNGLVLVGTGPGVCEIRNVEISS